MCEEHRVSGHEWEPCRTIGQEVELGEPPSDSLFKLELEGLGVGRRLGLGQRVMGGTQISYMEAITEVSNGLGFDPNFLTFSLYDLERITSLCLIFK